MSELKRFECTSGGAQYCYGCYVMTEDADGDYVRYADVEQRIAELEALLKERDGDRHAFECEADENPDSECTCGHDAVAKYFEGRGE